MSENQCIQAIKRSITYISSQQQFDGSFLSLSSKNPHDFSDAIVYKTTFTTAIILSVLFSIQENASLKQIKKRAADFLLSQKSTHWSWNYWAKNTKEFQTMPYPDDLDDTFCALSSLYLFDKKLITGSAYAYIMQLLTSVEKKEGGPYKTWLISKNTSGWDDVDIVVNSNIAYFLSLQDVTLPNLQSFFKKQLQREEINSSYYPTNYPLFYFLSRFYSEKKSIKTILLGCRNNNEYWENPLNTALAVLVLLNLDFPIQKLEKSISYLLTTQQKNHWSAYAFCIDPSKNGVKYYAGSSVLTSAFCLAAIDGYYRKQQIKEKDNDDEQKYYLKRIIEEAKMQLVDYEFVEQKEALMNRISKKDTKQQIPLMPYYFSHCLDKKDKIVKKKYIVQLGVVNLLGWFAYTIYDDFLDEEGNPQLLPLANICMRRLIHIFGTAFVENNTVAPFFYKVFDIIENANAWEVTHCRLAINNGIIDLKKVRFPDYGNLEKLAHKSFGHGLGPLTILLLLGYEENSNEFVCVYNFFIHYLIARQLHDDAHDWEEDLKKGHITFVVSLLLKNARKKGSLNKQKIFQKKTILELQKFFWRETIQEVCATIYMHIKKARKALKSCTIIIDAKPLEDLLEIYEKGADQALEERAKTIEFFKEYM